MLNITLRPRKTSADLDPGEVFSRRQASTSRDWSRHCCKGSTGFFLRFYRQTLAPFERDKIRQSIINNNLYAIHRPRKVPFDDDNNNNNNKTIRWTTRDDDDATWGRRTEELME